MKSHVLLMMLISIGSSALLLVLSMSSSASDREMLLLRGRSSSSSQSFRPGTRRERFPSVEERVKLYMSNWYLPPCHDNERHLVAADGENFRVENMTVRPYVTPDKLFHLNEDIVNQCARTKEQREYDLENNIASPLESYIDAKARGNMGMYCEDVVEVFDILRHLPDDSTPVLLQFGDMKHSHQYGFIQVPHFKKFRSATENLKSVTSGSCLSSPRQPLPSVEDNDILQPIIWRLATHRHYKHLPNVNKYDTPWNHKKDMAIFRGQLTGALQKYDKQKSARDNCSNMPRCQLVLSHANSTLVDAKLTATRKRLPDVLDGVDLVSPKVSIKFQMEYKGLIMLEGNDVASGLKWALLSQSVVLMPKPKHTSWAMEERLEPWVHYVPLNDKATDVENKVQWILDNDKEAQRIAQRASLWIEDMMYHPDAAKDEQQIKEEMIRRYRAHFVPASSTA